MSELKNKSEDFSRKQLSKIYNDALGGRVKDSRLDHIKEQICMTVPYIQYSPVGMKSLIDILDYCYNEEILEDYNSKLLDFVKDNSIDKDKIAGCFLGSVFAFLYKGPKCCDELSVSYNYLEHFSSYILMGNLDLTTSKKYSSMKEFNFDLGSLTELDSGINNSEKRNVSLENRLKYSVLINELKKHIKMYIYLNLEKYNYNYELYAVVMEDVFSNFDMYLKDIFEYSNELFNCLNTPFKKYDINSHNDRQVLEELIHFVIQVVDYNNKKYCGKLKNSKARILAV